MRVRIVFAVAVWASIVVGAVQLFDRAPASTGIASAAAVGAATCAAWLTWAVRTRLRRLHSWPRPGEVELYPPGPRRVLLIETGLAGPE